MKTETIYLPTKFEGKILLTFFGWLIMPFFCLSKFMYRIKTLKIVIEYE